VLRVAALLAVVAALGGCGGGQSDSSQLTSVTHRYFTAVANGNGSEACSLLSDTAKLSLRHDVKTVEPNTFKPTTLPCPQEVEAAHAILSGAYLSQLRNVTLGAPTVAGEGATIHVVEGSRGSNVYLTKTPAGWRIDTLGIYESTKPRKPRPTRITPTIEGVSVLERQLAAGEVQAATFNKRVRTVRLTLTNLSTYVLVKYGKGEEPKMAALLQAKGVPVTFLSQAEAEREAATFRGE
jgi:hypothetical protein